MNKKASAEIPLNYNINYLNNNRSSIIQFCRYIDNLLDNIQTKSNEYFSIHGTDCFSYYDKKHLYVKIVIQIADQCLDQFDTMTMVEKSNSIRSILQKTINEINDLFSMDSVTRQVPQCPALFTDLFYVCFGSDPNPICLKILEDNITDAEIKTMLNEFLN